MLSQITATLEALPDAVLDRSGAVFYSGKEAFSRPSAIYFLGLNPGGNPIEQASNTVRKHIAEFLGRGQAWSAYADDRWEGAAAGTWGMQPRVLHMFAALGLAPQTTPASNVVFVRSKGEADLSGEKNSLLAICWPVHAEIIRQLGVKVVVCFGATAGRWVRERLDANTLTETYRETNNRGWKSELHRAASGYFVVTVTHPARANWRSVDADPTPLVRRALELAGEKESAFDHA